MQELYAMDIKQALINLGIDKKYPNFFKDGELIEMPPPNYTVAEAGRFETKAGTWLIEGNLSISRFAKREQILIEGGLGTTFEQLINNNNNIIKYFTEKNLKDYQQLKGEDIVRVVNSALNNIEGIKDFHKRSPVHMKLCALHINLENEDRRYITDDQIERKIKDWEASSKPQDGFLDAGFFLTLAVALEPRLKEILRQNAKTIMTLKNLPPIGEKHQEQPVQPTK